MSVASHRGDAARVVNGGGDEEPAVAAEEERAAVVRDIGPLTRRRSGEQRPEQQSRH